MKPGKVRLPLSSLTILKLRRKLGMCYWHDCKKWWQETEDADIFDPSSLRSDAPLKPNNLTWTRNEIRQACALMNNGMSMAEIARVVGKKEKAVLQLRKRLFGLKQRFWTTQEQEKLLEAVRKKVPRATIAADLGRSLSSIRQKLAMLKKV